MNDRREPTRRILQVVADGRPGGGTTAVLGLCDDLIARGSWEIHLVSAENSYALREAARRGCTVYGLNLFSSRFDLSIPWKLRALIDRVRPDLIHAHGARAAHQFSIFPLSRLNSPLVYTVHGYHFRMKPQPLKWLGRLAERTLAKRVDHLCFVSRADENFARRQGILALEAAHSVIYNGIDPAEISSDAPVEKTHDLIFVGRMVYQKNPQFVIDVLEKLKKDGVTLLMVGGGDLETEVRQRAARLGVEALITFTGALERGAAIAALRRAKLFVFPSRWEGLPIGPIEAMHCGVPVVGSNVDGTSEVVSTEKDGILIDGFDPSVYAERIRNLLGDNTLRETMIQHGKKKVQQLFLRRAASEKYMALYDTLHAYVVERAAET